MKIIPLSEGTFTVDRTKEFIPFNTGHDELQTRPAGSLLVEIQPFAIVTSRDIVLLDTGLGFSNKDGTLQIHENLTKNNINPSDVTKVLISHLHKDHSGGVSRIDNSSSKRIITFPNATYFVNKQELDHAISKGSPSYIADDFKLLSEFDNTKYTEGEGIIDSYIHYQVTGAHSLFHQVFWVIEEGKKIFFGGDDAPQLQQMKHRFVAKYDFNGKKSMELRKEWWRQGEEEKWTFLFYHDIKSPVFEF
jgi:glyoxylase-like metal-dependent hydrolase (beta-lactamase superfamily II)